MENIEVKQAWHVTHEAITETTGFVIEAEGSYGGTSPKTFYRTPKAWKEIGYGDTVVFDEQEAVEVKKKKMEQHLKYLQERKNETQKLIEKMEEELKS